MTSETAPFLRGVSSVLRERTGAALLRSVVDSRAYVRALFLSSAVRLDALPHLVEPTTVTVLAARIAVTRADRLEAWLDVGVALRELQRDRADRYRVRGTRSRALARRHPLLVAHYRSMLDYQSGSYDDASELFQAAPGKGRDDLQRHADVIAEVSRAAEPFVVPYLTAVVRRSPPRRILDLGCGTGTALEAMLLAAPHARGQGIDLAPDVIAAARARFEKIGLQERADLFVGDIRGALAASPATCDLVTLLNNVYYFDPDDRVELYRGIRRVLRPGGALVVVTMETPGSVASAHLDFMLRSQAGRASLPREGEVERGMRSAGFGDVVARRIVPGQPFVAVRATPGA